MKLHIIKDNGDSVLLNDVKIVHVGDYCSIAERSDNIQFWSDEKQHDKVKHRTEIVFPK
jgi:hypothetical protein